jgi:tRNA modification GTPase
LRDPATQALLDEALILWCPGPSTATGEDVAELHLHGGRAVVAAVLDALGGLNGLRAAQAGAFTRRAFENGRIDLAEAEGLADLLSAETETQRAAALLLAGGEMGRRVEAWQSKLLHEAAGIEAALDFSDEGDVDDRPQHDRSGITSLAQDIAVLLAAPPAERLHDGIRIVLAGPPNAGKSSLFNVLVDRDAAIVSDIAGTTRDRIEAPVVLDGLPMIFIDTAGLRESGDSIEVQGVARAEAAVDQADIVLWLGDAAAAPEAALIVAAKCDEADQGARPGLSVSVVTGCGIGALRREIAERARSLLPRPGALALNARHRLVLGDVMTELEAAARAIDLLVAAEHLRHARKRLDEITGRAGTEDMLDTLFGRFCIGK